MPLLVDPDARSYGVLVAFSDRIGGVSRGAFASLNLSGRVDDDDDAVAENRRRVAAAAGFPPESLVLPRQVHGAHVVELDVPRAAPECDGLVARTPDVTAGVLTADCAPVIVAGERGVAALHAGWRGLVAGVVEAGVERVGAPRAAWVGPAIRACCYEVGDEVVDAFRARGLPVARAHRVDPADAAAAALRRAGVARVAVADECTSCDARYFSHRREGIGGRQGAFAAIVGAGAP